MKADPASIRDLIEQLRAVHPPEERDRAEPPLPPRPPSAKISPMPKNPLEWEPRVSRLEMDFCAAFVLIFGAIIASFLLTAGKIDDAGDKVANLTTDVRVVQTRQDETNRRLDSIDKKLDTVIDRLPAKR